MIDCQNVRGTTNERIILLSFTMSFVPLGFIFIARMEELVEFLSIDTLELGYIYIVLSNLLL